MISYRKYYLWISILILILGTLLAFWLGFFDKHKEGELVALIDVILTSIALVIAILEIIVIKNVTDEINKSVEETKAKFASILSLSDISRSTKTIEEIQSYLGNDKVEMAYLRLKDLRKVIIESQIRTLFNLLDDQKKIDICCAKVYSDIDDLHSKIYHGKTIDTNAVSKNLEKLSLTFTTLEEIIKKKSI